MEFGFHLSLLFLTFTGLGKQKNETIPIAEGFVLELPRPVPWWEEEECQSLGLLFPFVRKRTI
jgi:hypothetical protein